MTQSELNSTVVACFRTPKGRGYGIWEDNPDFNFNRDIKDIIAFESGGFETIICTQLIVEKTTN